MKKILLLLLVISLWSCNDDYLEKYPLDSLNSETFWKTANDLKIYNNRLYSDAINYSLFLAHYNNIWNSTYNGMMWEDCKSDNMAPTNGTLKKYTKIASGQNTVSDAPKWNWGFLRTCNVFLENYEKAEVSEQVKNQYAGETKLFRAWFYWAKVKAFGNVPWVENSLNIDSEELYGERTDRSEVMDHVLIDLNFACDHMPVKWSSGHKGRLNNWGALAVKARICLHEGTFRKYHGLPNADLWIKEAQDASRKIIEEGPYALSNNYFNLFDQSDLSGNKEMIFFMKYIDGILSHNLCRYTLSRSNGLSKDAVEDYLCDDGKPISLSSVYQGDDQLIMELTNRDPRLTQTILHPDNDVVYAGTSHSVHDYPRFVGMTGGFKCSTGYQLIKYFSAENYSRGYSHEQQDAPVIRLAEMMLIYAEASEELGNLTQDILDQTINLLRDRVNMPHMMLNPEMDTKYADSGLSSNLVEIRRERRIELMGEGFRYDDLMRWKMGNKLNQRVLGIRWEDYQANKYVSSDGAAATVKTVTIDGKTYIDVYQDSDFENRNFSEDRNYLFPIPLSALSQNPALGQNPNWE